MVFGPNDTEAVVETRLVIPLLEALGYDRIIDIVPKQKVVFQQGRKKTGRPNEVDFAIYNGLPHDKNTSLIAIEVKRPSEILLDAKDQAESYALALRTPIYIQTNGRDLEIWQSQLTSESNLLLECTVSGLAGRRGEIEGLISKQAAITLCQAAQIKSFAAIADEVTAYINAEIERMGKAKPFVKRTLSKGVERSPIEDSSLLSEFPKGVLITGPSGFGKSELSEHLFRTSLSTYAASTSLLIPLEVKLTDLSYAGISLLQYACDRISAHCPQITFAKLCDIFRISGALLFCDGFERVQPEFRKRISAEISAINRDFPKVALFIFSRPSVAREISLPALALCEFDRDQKWEFRKIFLPAPFSEMLWDLNSALHQRLGHPILLKLICESYIKNKARPQTFTLLFEEWLSRALEWDDPSPAIRAQRELALSLLAERTLFGPISRSNAFKILKDAGYGQEIFDALVASDALNVSENIIELVHEALADFLRAKHLANLPMPEFAQALKQASLSNDSLLVTLLMGQLDEPDKQRIVWRRLCELGIREYLGSFKFRADTSDAFLSLPKAERENAILTDILDGFEGIGTIFFPELWDEISIREVGVRNGFVGIAGNLANNFSLVSYSFTSRKERAPRVTAGRADNAAYFRGVNLKLSRRGLDFGRVEGIGVFCDNLKSIVGGRRLKGGINIARERLISRIRLLKRDYDFPSDDTDLQNIIDILLPYRKNIVRFSRLGNDEKDFLIEEVLADAITCRNDGYKRLDLWWGKYTDDHEHLKRDVAAQALLETYERAEAIFLEILEESFSTIRNEMNGYLVRPIQWRLHIDYAEGRDWSFTEKWFPVDRSRHPRATVNFVPMSGQLDLYIDTIREELLRLGRPDGVRISIKNGLLPRFDGYSRTGSFTGETPALSIAHEWILEELKWLFSDFPITF